MGGDHFFHPGFCAGHHLLDGERLPHPLVLLVYRLTEPVLAPVRSILPSFGGLDFSPVLVLIGIQVLERVLIQVLINLG